ncbi:MAG: NADH-quinone oxidoreductase subunit N [Chthoniobacterales bacterium]
MASLNPLLLETGVVCIGIVLLMLEAFAPKVCKRGLGYLALLGLIVVFVATFFVHPLPADSASAQFYTTDFLAMFFKRFALIVTALVLVMSLDYVDVIAKGVPGVTPNAGVGEYFILPLFTCAGLMWMASAVDFIMVFVSLELVTISFYVMVAYTRKNALALEAGTKFLILGALSTGFLVYGITWIFGITHQTNLLKISQALPLLPENTQTGLLFGLALVLVALGFKVAAAPFQFWIPDVYQGAPTPTTAFLSVGSKAAGFVVLLRVLDPFFTVPVIAHKLITVFVILAAATLLYGNLVAMLQSNLKRLLAYSSIAHAGYLLVGVASIGAAIATAAIAYYLVGYLLMTFLAFIVMLLVSKAAGGEEIEKFNGLGKRAPYLALAMLVAMVSLAGLPFTVGFYGKFLIFTAAIECHHWLLVVLGAISVACGFYYYLKVVRAMYWLEPVDGAAPIVVSPLSHVVITTLIALIFVFGVYPTPILQLLHWQ